MERKHMNEIREIIHRFRCGEGTREIARSLDLSRNTVRKYRDVAEEHGLLESAKPLPENRELGLLLGPPPMPRHMRSTVEPYEETVRDFLDQEVEIRAIWQRLREDYGYTGSYSSVRRFVRRLEPKGPDAVCRIETPPGVEAQVDFGSAGPQWDSRTGRRRRAWLFVMTLSNSRHQYVEFVFDQKIETWLRCHEEAFAWFGGVPRRVVLDNLKAGVIQPDLHDPVLGEPYRRLAQHYGFVISPNRPATPRHKGKVESGVHYVKRNFLAGQTFADLDSMNARVKRWILETAGTRIHGTTKETPLARFARLERDALQPLPEEPFDLVATYRAKVHRDCHVVADARYYSVPYRLIGQRVEVYVGRKIVEIYHGTELVTTHPVGLKRGSRQTRIEHYPEGKRAYMENPPERCRERAERVGPSCFTVVDTLLSERVHDRLRSVQSLLRLGEEVGSERLEAACRRTLEYGDPSYRRVKAVLQAGLEEEQFPEPVLDHSNSGGIAQYRYARSGASFFGGEVSPS
jgi:transposase